MRHRNSLEDPSESAVTVRIFLPDSLIDAFEGEGDLPITAKVYIPPKLNSTLHSGHSSDLKKAKSRTLPVNLEIHRISLLDGTPT
jgi:hypothetical protein